MSPHVEHDVKYMFGQIEVSVGTSPFGTSQERKKLGT